MSIPIFFSYFLGISLVVAFGIVIYLGLKSIGLIKSSIKSIDIPPKSKKEQAFFDKWFIKFKIIFHPPSENSIYLKIIFMVIGSRLILYLLGYFGIMLFKNQTGLDMPFTWNKWDAPHFLHIAENGYVNVGDEKHFIVFYPFYPYLVRLFNLLIHNSFFAGLLVSNISLVFAAIYLYKLVKLDFNHRIALNTVKFLLIFPLSFFLGIVYTDSLFLALTVMTFYYLRKENWLLTGLFGCLACLTRNFGILLLVPVTMEYFTSTHWGTKLRAGDMKGIFRDFLHGGWYLGLIPLGQLFYWYINKVVTGDWFTYLTYQREHWNNSFNLNIINNFTNYINNALTWKPADQICLWWPLIFSTFIAVIILFYSFRKIRVSYLAYFLVYLSIYLTSTWLISGTRYLMVVFPIYISFALLARNKVVNFLISFTSTFLLAFYTLAFVMDYYVM